MTNELPDQPQVDDRHIAKQLRDRLAAIGLVKGHGKVLHIRVDTFPQSIIGQ